MVHGVNTPVISVQDIILEKNTCFGAGYTPPNTGYSPASARYVETAIKGMAFFSRLLATPEGPRRTVLTKGMNIVASVYRGMLMTSGPDPKCAHLDEALLERYNAAAEAFPEMLAQLQAHMTYTAPFGKEFDNTFG